MRTESCESKEYDILNSTILEFVDDQAVRILDVGCGTGGNARLLREAFPDRKVYGVTVSESERAAAAQLMVRCWVADVEKELPSELAAMRFDSIICSHVLEHLRAPAAAVQRLAQLLTDEGVLLIAVPNVLFYRQRWHFLMGRFEYREFGVMDDTHLRFFTYNTAAPYLLSKAQHLDHVETHVRGNVPLRWLRTLFGSRISVRLDDYGCRTWPNLFGSEIVVQVKRSHSA